MSEKNETRSEGGLRAPAEYGTLRKLWWWFDFLVLVNLARLRFVAILAVIGGAILYWDTLVARYEKWTRPLSQDALAADPDVEYFCPMHPQVVTHDPREKCPICGMNLSKRRTGETAPPEALPAGVVTRLQLSPYRVVTAGVRTRPMNYESLTKKIETVGTVEFDERRLYRVAARVKGRIDKLYVSVTGQNVNPGDPLADVYSPDLVSTAQNLLDARSESDKELVRDRLRQWGVGDDQIRAMERAGKPSDHVTIRSPYHGHVVKKYPVEGEYVEESAPLFDLADLTTVWVEAQVYENETRFLKVGLPVRARTEALPNREFAGKVAFVNPHLEAGSRTLRVRFDIDNPDHEKRPEASLRPKMFATVTIDVPGAQLAEPYAARDGRILAVPEAAVVFTGGQKIVFRQESPNVFDAVAVEVGPLLTGADGGGFYPVVKGLGAGDLVVTTGSYLLDAETRVSPAAGSIYSGQSAGKSGPGGLASVRPTTPEDAEANVKAYLAKLSTPDRRIAEAQKVCPVLKNRLGTMGVPVKVLLNDEPVFLCCPGCEDQAKAHPERTLKAAAKRGPRPMIEKLIEYSIRNRFLVLLVAAALAAAGVYAVLNTPVDAIPDLSENQVIVFTDWIGRSPKEVQDQVTYPLSLKLQGLAGVKALRSSSEFNFSMITIIFEDNVDIYFARQRVSEKLEQAGAYLPPGVTPYLAPDATALGQIFWYTLEPGPSQPADAAQLWALNRYTLAPALNSVPGVAEVATVGGTPVEYQIDVRPESLRAYGVTLGDLYSAVARSNLAVGGRVIEKNGAEYAVRGVGYLGSSKDGEDVQKRVVRDLQDTVIRESGGTPVYVKNVATVQLGQQFRRSVFEKDGSEVNGGVVLMRYGQNPLAVTKAVKQKIQELQPELPPGVRVVPAYDRTRLITGAVHTLTDVMGHEMLIATAAILLILWHFRSAFVICVTLPLSVLFSFLLMWVLRRLNIIDIQANIMSLAGITISVGILVDQAIVMVENATHHLKEKFGDQRVTGDTRELVIQACRTVGRPIFFSVMIMLLSFVPVFALSGREGKYFHPLAFTKSFALLGVALISVTVVPALIPTFIKGRLRSEEDNWIVRSFINIYKPVLTWFFPHLNLVMWLFAALLILAAGMFPLQAILGLGASGTAWRICFLSVVAMVLALTAGLTRGLHKQALSLASLLLLALWAYHFRKIGVEFIQPLDEQTLLDMPVTAPRIGLTQAADDLKARDALWRGFPEVESVIGKVGRADTPTDPAGLDMAETLVNFRPKELWPRRVLRFKDAEWQARETLRLLEERGFVRPAESADDRDRLINDAAQKALERFDEVVRELALLRYTEFDRELGPVLTRFVLDDAVRRFREAKVLYWPAGADLGKEIGRLADALAPDYGPALSGHPALEDVSRLCQETARHLAALGALKEKKAGGEKELDAAAALALRESVPQMVVSRTSEALGAERKTFAGEVLKALETHRMELWRARVGQRINWELYDRGTEAYTWLALEELARAARGLHLLEGAPHGAETAQFTEGATDAQRDLGRERDRPALRPFVPLADDLRKPFVARVVALWPRQSGPDGDLVRDEAERVIQVPGWKNVTTQPIINRIEMLSTGVRNDVGVKVFGGDLKTIDRVSQEIAAALEPMRGAQGVLAWQIRGKDYLEVQIDRERAARYGVSVADVQETIEVALGGRVITQTVEDRNRFPVRVRYARANREDEESVKRLLVSGGVGGSQNDKSMTGGEAGKGPVQVPLSEVADVRVVEGPATIRSENGQLMNYVTLNVRGRDMVGFVEEAQRVVAEKVSLPEGVHVEWSGQFEHQIRAANTLRFIFPAVILLIFIILYLTYRDLADAALMMLAVPEALAGGAFFLFLWPKLRAWDWHAEPYPFSVAVWVGFIACFGMATETGIIMLVYLREAIDKRGGLENIQSLEELRQAVIEGAVHRLRPKLLTEGVAIIAIFPMVFASGVGGEILAPMALPVLGGLLISDEVVDIFLPVRFYWVRRARWLKLQEQKRAGYDSRAVPSARVALP